MRTLRILAVAALAPAAAMEPAFGQQRQQQVVVINQTDAAIEFLYFASCGAGEWGKDRLGAKEIVKPGARRLFRLAVGSTGCCHDMRAKLQTGASRQRLNVDICREAEWVVR